MARNSLKIGIAGTDFTAGTGPCTYLNAMQECLGERHFLCHLAGCAGGELDLCHLADAKRVPFHMLESLHMPVIADFHDDYWTRFSPYPSPDLPLRYIRQRTLLAHHLEVLKRSSAVIVHSREVAESLENVISENLDTSLPVHLVRYGVKPGTLHDGTNFEHNVSSPLILFAGRDMFRKGFPLAVKALRKILPEKPGARLRVIGEEYLHTRVAGRLLALGLPVEFLPVQSADELQSHYHEASVLVLPSRQEAFGIVLLEAMFAGLPVVAARVGGIPEAIEDNVSGLLHRAGDGADLAKKVLDLLDDGSLRERIIQGGLERAQSFSLSAMQADLEKAYYSVIGDES